MRMFLNPEGASNTATTNDDADSESDDDDDDDMIGPMPPKAGDSNALLHSHVSSTF